MKINLLVAIVLLAGLFACNNAKKNESQAKAACIIEGNIEGIKEGTLVLNAYLPEKEVLDTVAIKNGKFEIKLDCSSYQYGDITINKTHRSRQFFFENGQISITGHVDSLRSLKVSGSKAEEEFQHYMDYRNAFESKYSSVYNKYNYGGLSEDEKKKMMPQLDEIAKKRTANNLKYLNDYPLHTYNYMMILQSISGKSIAEAKEFLASINPKAANRPDVQKLMAEMMAEAKNEVSLNKMMAGVKDISYQVDTNFKGNELTDILYLGLMSDNLVCAIKDNGQVQIISPEGKVLNSFDTGQKNTSPVIAVGPNDDIYVLENIMEKVIQKVRGRKVEKLLPKNVKCVVYSGKGEKKTEYPCKGLVMASGAKVIDGTLVVASSTKGKIGFFKKDNGKVEKIMEGMRPCCGILDFAINDKKEILVADLGAFRIKCLDNKGNEKFSFGKRGKEMNNFHGCCNPVGVSYLSTGAIVTVEKDPTRIKVYSKDGAKQIQGIQELVNGCSYIPMIVDSNDNLYLASKEKGLVKCIATN
jgi:hypothetical protein